MFQLLQVIFTIIGFAVVASRIILKFTNPASTNTAIKTFRYLATGTTKLETRTIITVTPPSALL
jgi:hypothetical protein